MIGQHIDKLLKGVGQTNLGLGTPDAAALTVRIVRGWANDMAMAFEKGQDANVVLPIDWKTPTAGRFVQRASKRPGPHARNLQLFARPNESPATRGSGSDVTMAGLWSARQGAGGKDHGP